MNPQRSSSAKVSPNTCPAISKGTTWVRSHTAPRWRNPSTWPRIKVAELAGYGKVVDLAHRAGINEEVLPTPSMAIGAYVATPLEMAGAYTVFANEGVRVQPTFLSLVKEPGGRVMLDQKPEKKPVLDPRVNAVLVDMLQEVMRSGTAAGVRGRGFIVPAAGKTGTDPTNGWFAGFTSDLLCIVWVGFDDNRPLQIEGAKSALPVWTEFMKRAITLRQYSNPKPFVAPEGVVTVAIDPQSGLRASPSCPQRPSEQAYIAGTEPTAFCGKSGATTVSGWDVSSDESAPPAQGYIPGPPRRGSAIGASGAITTKNPAVADEQKKKGLFDHVKDIFR